MSVLVTPGKRWTDHGEDVTYDGLERTGLPTATVEPETAGLGPIVEADLAAIVATAPVGIPGQFTISGGDIPVVARTAVVLALVTSVPVGNAYMNSVVIVEERDAKIYYEGYVREVPDGIGGTVLVVNLVAYNLALTDATILDTTVIKFVVLLTPELPQPNTPNAALIVARGKHWAQNEPLTVQNLNAMALPSASIAPGTISGVELNSQDVRSLAARYLPAKRGTITTSLTTIAPGGIVTIGTCTISGVTAGVVRISQPTPVPLYTGYVSAANSVIVQARNNGFGTAHIAAGLVLNVLVF